MSYQQYMNMGFGPPGGTHPYMMGFQGGMPMQMPTNPAHAQYVTNHIRPPVNPTANVPTHHPHPQMLNRGPVVGVGGHPMKRKMNTDPNRPKRPTSAYFFFVQLEREEAARRGEKITRVAEWTKQVSAKWRELTTEGKEFYQNMAANDKARYTSQMAAYTGKDANRPKRPQSAYFLWLADFRARMKNKIAENKELLRAGEGTPSSPITPGSPPSEQAEGGQAPHWKNRFVENKESMRTAGEEWRRMTTQEKSPYEQRAEEERRKYEQSMKEYNMAGGSAAAKKQRVEEAQRDAKTAAAAVSQSLSSFHTQHAATGQQQPQQVHAQQPQQQQSPPQLQAPHQQLPQPQLIQQQQQQQQLQQQHQTSEDFDDGDDDDDDDDDFDDEDE